MANKTRELGNLATNNLFSTDVSNGRLGIGSTTPSVTLDVVGVVSATSFVGDGSGLTGVGIGTDGSVNTTGIVSATSFVGDGSGLTGVGIGTDGSVNTTGIITATSFVGPLTGNATGLTGSPSITVADITATGNVSIAGTLTYEDVTNIDSIGIVTARSGIHVTDGEVSLGTGTSISSPSVNTLTLGTDSVERVRIDRFGKVGIGSDAPTDILDVSTGTGDEVTAFKVKTGGQIEISRNHANAPYIRTSMTSGNPSLVLGRIGLNQDLVISANNGISFPTGKGIDFSFATGGSGTSSSALLDDYEEGTWTPRAFNNASGSSTTSTSTRYATYIKIGRLVHIQAYISVSKGSVGNSVNYTIDNLPFTAEGTANLHSAISIGYYDGLSVAVSTLFATAQPNSTQLLVRYTGSTSTQTYTAVGQLLNTTHNIVFGGSYMAT